MGKKIICYFSAGTSEVWRPDYHLFKVQDQGANLPLWPGEKWLNVRSPDVWQIMQRRIKFAGQQGCDAIDPDNMDGYSNERGGGFMNRLTQRDAITYTKRLAREAQKYGMATGLKNAEEIISRVREDVQFAVNEECAMDDGGCKSYRKLLNQDRNAKPKPVFHIEYVTYKQVQDHLNRTVTSIEINKPAFRNMSPDEIRNKLCLIDRPEIGRKMSTVIKTLSLDGWVLDCSGVETVTRTRDVPHDKNAKPKGRVFDKQEPEADNAMAAYESILGSTINAWTEEEELALQDDLDEVMFDFEEPAVWTYNGAAKDRRGAEDFEAREERAREWEIRRS